MARILYLTPSYTPHDYRFLKILSQRGETVWFLSCMPATQALEQRPVPEGVQTLPALIAHDLPWMPWTWWDAKKQLRHHVAQIKPDVIHAGPLPLGAFLAAWSQVHPLLAMSWGSDILVEAQKSFWPRWKTRRALQGADAVLADCQAVKESAQALASLREDQFVILPWGVDVNRFKPAKPTRDVRADRGWAGNPVVIYTRGFQAIHEPLTFLRAMIHVMRERADVRVLMLGRGPYFEQARRMIADQHLDSQIYLAGQISNDQLPDYFRAADLYVSTTTSDGSSISLLEAMASALPVIVVDAFGNKEWVSEGQNGWLTPPRDDRALAATLSQALSDSERRKRYGLRSREIATERADWNRNIDRLLDMYRRLAKNKAVAN